MIWYIQVGLVRRFWRMAKHLAPEKMGLVNEGLQCWNKLEDQLAFKLSQLTKLLHHFSAYPPEADLPDANPEEIASQHESEIHDILNETASRIRFFKSSLQIQEQDNRLQEAVEAMKKDHEAMERAMQTELKQSKAAVKQLEQSQKETERVLQDSIKAQAESFARDMAAQKIDLQTKTDELENARLNCQRYRREAEELKKCHQAEMEHERGQLSRFSQDLVLLSQSQSQLQAREQESREQIKSQQTTHRQALEEMKAVHTAEVERLKLESFVELEKLSQDSASRESEWHHQRLELQKQLATSSKEMKERKLSAEKNIISLKATEEALAKEKISTSNLQMAMREREQQNQLLKENMNAAVVDNEKLSRALATMKKEASESRMAYNSALSKWEAVAVQLRKDLESMTGSCAASELEIKSYQTKVDELAFELVTTRKELSVAETEIGRLNLEVRKSKGAMDTKDAQIQQIEAKSAALNSEISRLQLECIAQNENSALKMKEIMEERIQQQSEAHESDVQSLQKAFISQLEEDRKESQIQQQALEGNLSRQREEKERAKERCDEFAKVLTIVQQKLTNQESMSVQQLLTYDAKFLALLEKFDKLEGSGSYIEREFESLSTQVMKHSNKSKQVGYIQQKSLREAEEECVSLKNALANITKEHTASAEQHTVEVERLKQAMDDNERAHNEAVTAASEYYNAQIQQGMDDVQRLKDEHNVAISKMLEAHERELANLRRTIEAKKLEFEEALQGQKGALHEMQKKHDKLLRSNLALKKDQSEAVAEVERCRRANNQALTSCSENWSNELARLEKDHRNQVDSLEDQHSKEVQEMHMTFHENLLTTEEIWKQKLDDTRREWKCKLDNDSVLWKIEHAHDIEELRRSLMSTSTEEKTSMALDHKIRVCKLENRITELETLVAQKDERVRRLVQDIARMDESNKMFILDLNAKHKANLCDILEKQKRELSEVQKGRAVQVKELQETHRVELETAHVELEKVKEEMTEKRVDLERKFDKLQERFENRESRDEDVAYISRLQETCEQKDKAITKLNGRTNQLMLELHNREENYNRLFGNTPPPVIQQGVSDWLKPTQKSDVIKFDNSKPSASSKREKSSKMDAAKVALLQKRAASATRHISKSTDNDSRSTSTFS